jgi:hypothetical protein
MSKGEKFLSEAERQEFCWFCDWAEADVSGVHSTPLHKTQVVDDHAGARDTDGPAIDRLDFVRRNRRVETIILRVLSDNPGPIPGDLDRAELKEMYERWAAEPDSTTGPKAFARELARDELSRAWGSEWDPFTLGQAYIAELLAAYSDPPPMPALVGTRWDGEREVFHLENGATFQRGPRGMKLLNGPSDAIPGLVWAEGSGFTAKEVQEMRARLAAACSAYLEARDACGFGEPPYAEARLSKARAAEEAGVNRAAFSREPSGIDTTIHVTSADAHGETQKEQLSSFLKSIATLRAKKSRSRSVF